MKLADYARAALICFLALLASQLDARADKRIALVIGNAAYRNTVALANPVNDSADTAAALKKVGFTVILQQNLDKAGMESAIAQFARLAQDADVALFYYAGHGMQYRGANYLVPIDAKLQDEFKLTFELTHLDDVLFGLERARGVKILILDACRDNPLLDHLTQTASTRDLLPIHGFAKVVATRGMVIAYSTQVNEVAVDGAGRNSPFTDALIKEIAEPRVEIGTMFRRVASDVDKATHGQQLPELSISLVGDFYLNTHDTDVQAWVKIRSSSDRNVFANFIGDYPDSVLVGDAREHIAALDRAAEVEAQATRRAEAERAQAEREARTRQLAEQAERERLAKEQAAREQAERDRLLREKAAREQEEKDRVAKEQAERERLASEPQPIREPKQEVQQVPSSAQPANTEVAKPKPEEQTAMLTPPAENVVPKPEPTLTGAPLTEAIKKELQRVGCYSGNIDANWSSVETKSSVRQFVKFAKLTAPDDPSIDFLNTLRSKSGRVCPLICGRGEIERNGQCVVKAKVPAAGEKGAAKVPYDPNDMTRRITSGGSTTCGPKGCEKVPIGCVAVRGSGGHNLGGKIICGSAAKQALNGGPADNASPPGRHGYWSRHGRCRAGYLPTGARGCL